MSLQPLSAYITHVQHSLEHLKEQRESLRLNYLKSRKEYYASSKNPYPLAPALSSTTTTATKHHMKKNSPTSRVDCCPSIKSQHLEDYLSRQPILSHDAWRKRCRMMLRDVVPNATPKDFLRKKKSTFDTVPIESTAKSLLLNTTPYIDTVD